MSTSVVFETTLKESDTCFESYLSLPGNVTTTSYVPGFKSRGKLTFAIPSVTFT